MTINLHLIFLECLVACVSLTFHRPSGINLTKSQNQTSLLGIALPQRHIRFINLKQGRLLSVEMCSSMKKRNGIGNKQKRHPRASKNQFFPPKQEKSKHQNSGKKNWKMIYQLVEQDRSMIFIRDAMWPFVNLLVMKRLLKIKKKW